MSSGMIRDAEQKFIRELVAEIREQITYSPDDPSHVEVLADLVLPFLEDLLDD